MALSLLLGCRTGYVVADRDTGMDAGDTGGDPDTGVDASDAGEADAPTTPCIPVAEVCNGEDDDCDELADEEFDTATDIANCGACDTVCDAAENAAPACNGGTCGLLCSVGFDDCNDEPADGCEASLTDAATCGDCTTACVMPLDLCSDGTCVASCSAGETRCGDTCANLENDASHCGGCGITCDARANATVACVAGTCEMTCLTGFASCDGDPMTGCEAGLVGAYADTDGDGFGVGSRMEVCPPLGSGFAGVNGDCDDGDIDAFPGQPLFFGTERASGGYDYDCNGGEQAQYRLRLMCACCDPCMLLRAGFLDPIPRCGESGTLVTDCRGSGVCIQDEMFIAQPCH